MQEKNHLELLDGMRGLAAVLVVLHHLGGLLQLPWLAPRGYLAVDFFFLLSGYVLTHAYWHRLQSGLSVRRFAVVRAVRLYPMIVFGMAVGAVCALYTFRRDPIAATDAAIAVVLGTLAIPIILPSSLPAELFPFDGPLWSIFVELVANAVFVLLATGKRGLFVSLLLMLIGAVSLLVVGHLKHELSVGSRLIDWPWGFARVSFSFTAGVLVHSYRHVMPRLPPGVAIVAVCTALLLPRFERHGVVFDLFAVLVVFPLAIASLSASPSAWRMKRICQVSGEISYPVYAVHYPFALALGSTVTLRFLSWQQRSVIALGATVLLVGFAWLVSRRYDRPVRQALSRRLGLASGR